MGDGLLSQLEQGIQMYGNQLGHLSVTRCQRCKGHNTQSKLEALSSLTTASVTATPNTTAAASALNKLLAGLCNYYDIFAY